MEEDVSPIKVKHLIEYLSQFDPELTIELDKDGWLEHVIPHKDEVDLIQKRGIFFHFKNEKYEALYLNNQEINHEKTRDY